MIQMLKLVLLSCVCVTIRSTTGHVLPPQNLSMVWMSDFEQEFFWEPPPHPMINCQYETLTKTMETGRDVTDKISDTSCSEYLIMQGGFLHFSINTICNESETSEPVVFEVRYPELVKDLECYAYAAEKVYCSWSPASKATDLQFFYRLKEALSNKPQTELQKCPSYNLTGGEKIGCGLEANTSHFIYIVFNATLNNTLVRNTFKKPLYKVKPPAPEWNIRESKDRFNISWIPPDVLKPSDWKFVISYNECSKSEELKPPNTFIYSLNRVPHCKYCISIQARSENGNTTQSGPKCFDPIVEGFTLQLFVAIFTPLVIAFLVGVTCCCWIYKSHIFPKIPKPRDLLSESLSNNNVSSLHKLYIPAEEEENCCVTLIIDTQTNKPNC